MDPRFLIPPGLFILRRTLSEGRQATIMAVQHSTEDRIAPVLTSPVIAEITARATNTSMVTIPRENVAIKAMYCRLGMVPIAGMIENGTMKINTSESKLATAEIANGVVAVLE